MAELHTPQPVIGPPTGTELPQEIVPQTEATPEPTAPVVPEAVQVDRAVFLAARLREVIASEANLRDEVANLLKENAQFRAIQAQREIDVLDSEFDVGKGTILQKRPDGTYWRIPEAAIQRG